jgi:hypothetical protein
VSAYSSGRILGSLLSQGIWSLSETVIITEFGLKHRIQKCASDSYNEIEDHERPKDDGEGGTRTSYYRKTQRLSFKLRGDHGDPISHKLGREPHIWIGNEIQ